MPRKRALPHAQVAKLLAPRVGNDSPGLEQHNSRSQQQRFSKIVRHKDDRLPQLPGERREFALQFRSRHRIKCAERLVHQQNGRIGRQSPGDPHALALSARKLTRPPSAKLLRVEAHEPQQLRYARFDLPTRPALQRRHQPHVFCHREVREQPRLLNHIPDAAPQLDAVPIGGRFLVYENFSLRWNEKPVGEFQEGSLSASTASQQNQGLSGGDLQRDIRNNFPHRAAAGTETYILKLDRAADGLWRCQMRLQVLREPLV